VRKGLIDTVLATDMSRHFILVNKFTTVFGTDEELLSGEGVSEVSCYQCCGAASSWCILKYLNPYPHGYGI
jgi:hypothetical protein